MSQNKTVIQGLSADANYPGQSAGAGQSFYSRSSQSNSRGTIVPGMQNPVTSAADNTPSTPQPSRNLQAGKPVVGFLYSVSRTPFGEFWPIQMGKNSIGQSADCDIVLREGTVSSHHAVIVTRVGKNGIIAAIKDPESTNGTFINGERIDFEAEEIHNGDIITLGNNYQCLFLLIDAAKLGLSPIKDFISVDVNDSSFGGDLPTSPTSNTTRTSGFNPFDGNSSWGSSAYTPSDGTVGMDGSMLSGRPGGTVSM